MLKAHIVHGFDEGAGAEEPSVADEVLDEVRDLNERHQRPPSDGVGCDARADRRLATGRIVQIASRAVIRDRPA